MSARPDSLRIRQAMTAIWAADSSTKYTIQTGNPMIVGCALPHAQKSIANTNIPVNIRK